MSIASTTNRNGYTGNGAAHIYAYGFRITDQSHLLVTVTSNATPPVETTLTITTDYTVSGVNAAAGGNVTLVNASQSWLTSGELTTGYLLTIRRVVPLTQPTDIRNQGSFLPETHEDVFDRLTMADQQQQDEINRSLALPESEAGTSANTTLPAAATRASKYLSFDASGNPTASTTITGGTSATAFAQTVLDDSTAPIALTTYRGGLAAETAPAVDDELFLYDLSATTVDKITLANLLKVIDALTAETAPDVADELALYDASASTTDKITLANLLKVINTLTADATPDTAADYVVTYDASAAAAKKVLLSAIIPAAAPVWIKYTKAYTDLSTAGTTNNIEVLSLPAKGTIHAVAVKHSTAFSGGAISAYVVSVGITGNLTKYTANFDVFAAVAATTAQITNAGFVEDFGSATSIKLAATSTGANLNAATAGSVDVWILWSTLP